MSHILCKEYKRLAGNGRIGVCGMVAGKCRQRTKSINVTQYVQPVEQIFSIFVPPLLNAHYLPELPEHGTFQQDMGGGFPVHAEFSFQVSE